MKKINDEIDFLIYSNPNLKNSFKINTDLKQEIKKYLDKIDNFLISAKTDEKKLLVLLKNMKEKYVIQEIPDSYMKYSKGYIQDLGYYNPNSYTFRTQLNDEQYKNILNCLQTEQINSLIPWIEFLINKEKDYPIWFRYYIFNKIVKIGSIYVAIEKFNKRSKSTTNAFIFCNYEILEKIYNLINKYINNSILTDEESKIINDDFQFEQMYFKIGKKYFDRSELDNPQFRGIK